MTRITIELPDCLANQLGADADEMARRVLEAVVLEGYRSQRLSRGEVGQLLGLSWQQVEEFLASHGVPYHYAMDDLAEDRGNLKKALGPP